MILTSWCLVMVQAPPTLHGCDQIDESTETPLHDCDTLGGGVCLRKQSRCASVPAPVPVPSIITSCIAAMDLFENSFVQAMPHNARHGNSMGLYW